MNELQIFNNEEFGQVRTVVIEGEPWFVGKDVAKALGYKNTNQAIKDNTDEDDRGASSVATPSGNQNMVTINESGLYSLIFGSKLESAKKFKRWVTSEVLPALHKTGSYNTMKPLSAIERIQLNTQAVLEVHEEVKAVNEDLQQFKQDMPILGIEEDRITSAVRKVGVRCLGGKKSNAYNDRSLRARLYSDIYRELYRQFGIATYKAIKRSQCNIAVNIIEAYAPPLILAEQIADCNAQINMEVA